MNLNRVLLIGNLTKDPELRYTPSGTPVGTLRLAINSSYKSQTGERKEETCFVNVIVWSRQAETCNQYLKKGRAVFVEGRLVSRSWEAEGQKRSTMEVRADRVQFLGGGVPSAGQAGGRGDSADAAPARPGADDDRAGEAAPVAGGVEDDAPADSDVPF